MGEVAPSGRDIRDDATRDSFKVGNNRTVFDVIEDLDGVRHNSLCGVKNLSWQRGGDMDDIVEGIDHLLREMRDDVWNFVMLQLRNKVFGCIDIGFEGLDDIAGYLANILNDITGA